MTTPITITSLSKHYGSERSPVKAVDVVSLSIGRGQLFFMLGPSGCGKTTLLRMIAGFIEPTAGSIRFGERDVTRLAPNKRNTGMVFQSYALWPHMTVFQNVAFGLTVRKIKGEELKRRTMDALRAVQMEPYAERKPGELSGGQQQRVALGRALVVEPQVLLLDEPLSNLDAKLRNEMRHEIKRICSQTGITTVYVTHDQKEALSMADAMAVMRAGKVEQVGEPRAMYDRPASRFVAEFLGETNFIEARVVERRADGLTLESPAGRLTAKLNGAPLPEESQVTCSVRPEAWRVVSGGDNSSNILSGSMLESVYLGGMAQHTVELSGNIRVRVAELNPPLRRESGNVRVVVDPHDVVILTR